MAKFKIWFPTIPIILLVIGILWLLGDLGMITIDIPWLPIILVLCATGWLINSLIVHKNSGSS